MGKSTFSSRTKARSRAVDVLFEARQKDLDDPAGIWGLTQERQVITTAQTTIPPYTVQICQGVADHLERIDASLNNYSQGWPLNRMPEVDLAILRVAMWELLYNEEIDGPTIISEAMKIAREKSTDGSPKFINGLLGRINDLREVLVTKESDEILPEYGEYEQLEEPDFSSGIPTDAESVQIDTSGENIVDDTDTFNRDALETDEIDAQLGSDQGTSEGEQETSQEYSQETDHQPEASTTEEGHLAQTSQKESADIFAQIDLDNLEENI